MARRKKHEEYIGEVNIINHNISVVGQYINGRTPITHRCLLDKHVWMARPGDVLMGHGCPVCAGHVIGPAPEYKNSIWASRYKEYFSNYMSEEQMKKYMPQGSQKLKVICPDCGIIKEIRIRDLFRQGLGCICNDKISFANKFVFNVLQQINVKVKPEYSPEWACGKKYDSYLIDYNLIIENHGRQHYEECTLTGRTLLEEQENDRLKEHMALSNGIKHYVVLDCANSTKEYIKQSIMRSILPFVLQFMDTDVDWDQAAMFAHTNLIKVAATLFNDGMRTKEIAETLCVNRTSVCRWLNTASELGLCNYQPKEEIRISCSKQIICIELNKVFNSLTEAARCFSTTTANINMCLRGHNQRACGYHWKYIM